MVSYHQIHFNPRTPLQSAIAKARRKLGIKKFQSTHSVTECDLLALTTSRK